MRRISLFGVLALAIGLLFGVAPQAAAAGYIKADEKKVLEMVNETRASKGLKALKSHPELVGMARGQTDRMIERGDIYHNPRLAEEITERGLDWLRVGENVGMGPNVEVIQQAFLDSPGHYKNIVHKDYDHAGIGVAAAPNGRIFVTQVFADLRGSPKVSSPSTPAPTAKPKPAPTAAPTPAPTAAPTPQPTLAPAPTPRPTSVLPNAVVGGVVNKGFRIGLS